MVRRIVYILRLEMVVEINGAVWISCKVEKLEVVDQLVVVLYPLNSCDRAKMPLGVIITSPSTIIS
jgi:exosome complex RNA-binding protein Rrp4